MKHIMSVLAIFVIAILTPLKSIAAPNQVPLGPSGILDLLSMAKRATVRCAAPSAPVEFNKSVELGEFKSISDVENTLNQIEVSISVSNPKDQIRLSANLEDENGTALFRADTYFSFEKVGYDQLGRPRYELPQWVGYLYFTASDITFEFYGAREAILYDLDGREFYLDVEDNEVTIPGWVQGGQYSYLLVRDHMGVEYFYDFNNGRRLMQASDRFEIMEVSMQNVSRATPDFNGELNLWTWPEWGYCPCFEVSGSGPAKLYMNNEHWFRPKFVRLTTLANRRAGELDQILEYEEGMVIELEEGEPTFILLEFEEWVYDSWRGDGRG